MEFISWSDFEKINIRVGTIKSTTEFEGLKKPAFKLVIDFGPELGIKQSSAQITALYQPQELIGKQVIAV
ncbi:MAG TPA: tRNA-binding protein, partial [Chitinophagaceae bacterium]